MEIMRVEFLDLSKLLGGGSSGDGGGARVQKQEQPVQSDGETWE